MRISLQQSRRTRRRGLERIAAIVLVISTALPGLPRDARADAVSLVNALRTAGCSGEPGVGTPVQAVPELDEVARELSRRELEAALERVGYPAASARSLHIRGSWDDDAIEDLLAESHCEAINNPRYDEIGVFSRRGETWIVLAVRKPPPPELEPRAVAERVLELVNAARAQARLCGSDRYEPAEPVMLSPMLNAAASRHSSDMAARGSAGHRGSDGTEAGERITQAGYTWRASGENVAAGQPDADAVVTAWLESPGHCATLMGPHFADMGIAYTLAPEKDPEIYWTQVFAAPMFVPDTVAE